MEFEQKYQALLSETREIQKQNQALNEECEKLQRKMSKYDDLKHDSNKISEEQYRGSPEQERLPSVARQESCEYRKSFNNVFGCRDQIQRTKNEIEVYSAGKDVMTDSITIIGRDRVYIQMKMFANNEFVEIGAERFVYDDVWRVIECTDSATKWIMLTTYGMVIMMASSPVIRRKFISFIQSMRPTEDVAYDSC